MLLLGSPTGSALCVSRVFMVRRGTSVPRLAADGSACDSQFSSPLLAVAGVTDVAAVELAVGLGWDQVVGGPGGTSRWCTSGRPLRFASADRRGWRRFRIAGPEPIVTFAAGRDLRHYPRRRYAAEDILRAAACPCWPGMTPRSPPISRRSSSAGSCPLCSWSRGPAVGRGRLPPWMRELSPR
jgi:hypothetical protein